jgi:hypothetical protein
VRLLTQHAHSTITQPTHVSHQVNLIMDTLGALALATETPSAKLLVRCGGGLGWLVLVQPAETQRTLLSALADKLCSPLTQPPAG